MGEQMNPTLVTVRYVVPGVLLLAGFVVLFAAPSGALGGEGFALFAGAAASILLLNVLYRMGVQGDQERDREDAARAYFDAHGRWPDDGDDLAA